MKSRSSMAYAAIVLFGASFVATSLVRRGTGLPADLPEASEAAKVLPIASVPSSDVEKERSGIPVKHDVTSSISKENPWDHCLSTSSPILAENELLECVARGLMNGISPPGPEVFGAWICASEAPKASIRSVAIEFLARIPPSEALDYIDSTQRNCARYESTAFFQTCFSYMKNSHPEWLALVGQTLTPDILFDQERGVAVIQAAHTLSSLQGGDWAEYLLAEGGLGNFGGTPTQIDKAIAATLTLKESPTERLRYISEVLNSINTPGGGRVGNTVMHFLFARTGECWPNGNSKDAMMYANRLLDDDRFRRDASVQLLYEYNSNKPPAARILNVDDWEALIARAKLIK